MSLSNIRGRRKGERGNVMVMTAILAVGIVLAVGLCIDVSRVYMIRTELQNAADAAALAAARELNSGTSGIQNAFTRATNIVNNYGFNRAAITIATVEFSDSLNGTYVDSATAQGNAANIKFVRVTTQSTATTMLFAIRALGNSHAESRTATAGMSPGINTICDFFPIAVALSDPHPLPNTAMTLTIVEGDPNGNTLVDKNYILIDVPQISGNGEKETVLLAAGVANLCQTINVDIPFHVTPSGNKTNGPKQIAWGANSRFDNPGKGYVDPAIYPPDTNIREGITFDQYINKTLVTAPSHTGKDERRILIVPIITPGTYDAIPGPPTVRFGAFFLKSQIPDTAALDVEWIDESLVIGGGGFDPNGGCTSLTLAVLYK